MCLTSYENYINYLNSVGSGYFCSGEVHCPSITITGYANTGVEALQRPGSSDPQRRNRAFQICKAPLFCTRSQTRTSVSAKCPPQSLATQPPAKTDQLATVTAAVIMLCQIHIASKPSSCLSSSHQLTAQAI